MQRVCEVAGLRGAGAVPAPDLRARPCAATAATSPTGAFRRCTRWRICCPSWPNAGLPLVAIHIPGTGAPSRKERDELKAFGQERGLRVYDDRQAPGARLSRADGQGARALRRRRRTTCWCWRPGPASRRAIVPRRPSTRRAASCACTARRSSTTATSCSTRRISSSSGWWTSPCSNGTRKRTAGTRRTIRSPRCTTRTSRS